VEDENRRIYDALPLKSSAAVVLDTPAGKRPKMAIDPTAIGSFRSKRSLPYVIGFEGAPPHRIRLALYPSFEGSPDQVRFLV